MPVVNRILVVDDEEMNLDLCSRRLRRSGFACEVAGSGSQAIAMIEEGHFDLVLLDQMMPNMSGLEVLATLRQQHSSQRLPIVMLTAIAEGAKVAEALDLGANDYITKPIDFTVALARIRSQLSRRSTESALERSEERYALAARGSNDGLWDWDLVNNLVYYSPRWMALLGLDEQDAGSDPEVWLARVHPRDRSALEQAIQQHLENLAPSLQCECRMRHSDGSYRWMSVRGLAVRSETGEASRMVGSHSDVTDSTTIDPLTGLSNRILFHDRVETALERRQTDPSSLFAILYMDLDRFKLINDSLGHQAGDRVLAEVAGRLQASVRADKNPPLAFSDSVVARLGGDEFAILVENIPGPEIAERIAERVLKSMRPAVSLESGDIYCGASIGIAIPSEEVASLEELLRNADTAMYAAKMRGKGCWAVFESSMRETQQNRLRLENDLRLAVQRSEFEVYYQPRVALSTGLTCGFEALVRWNHPTRGLLPPGEFISIAEENGLINEIGMYVLREACRQVNEWNLRSPAQQPLDVAVNLSPRQCMSADLVQKVRGVLNETGLPSHLLNLELTESLLVEDMSATRKILNDLKGLGIGLKLDDFGTGFASLKTLSELPFDTLKIDRSFILALDADGNDSVDLVRTILLLAENLKMEVIAEGIETKEHVARLLHMGCDFGQGYYYSKPVSGSTVESLFNQNAGRDLTPATSFKNYRSTLQKETK